MNIVQPIRNREDIEKMKAVLKRKKRDLVLFIFGINCGLRISDILKLNVGDVKGRDFVEIKEKKTKKNKRFPLNPELKVVLEDFSSVKVPLSNESKTYKFKSSPIISPIYGIENKEKDTDIELENTANYEKLDQEIKKTNEFLMTLRELQKKLD